MSAFIYPTSEALREQLKSYVNRHARLNYELLRHRYNEELFKAHIAEKNEVSSQLSDTYRQLTDAYCREGSAAQTAEHKVNRDYITFREEAERRYPKIEVRGEGISGWMNDLTLMTIEKLRHRHHRLKDLQEPAEGAEPEKVKQYQNLVHRRECLAGLLIEHDMTVDYHESPLFQVIYNYMEEFVRQTSIGLPDVNIKGDKNPEARAFWELLPREELDREKEPSLRNSARTFHVVSSIRNKDMRGSVSWELTGNIIKDAIDVFKEQYRKLETGDEPCASVYNDYFPIVALSTHPDISKELFRGKRRDGDIIRS